ncbi:LamG-like jellyroll fold domain-containing protein [Lacipirellula parvula]|uniref:LamG-like jellyroll fold domain-containing protein n=1 Tax=Lacipirellula parvula TaxID=2650471 RepID=A0A5K7X876_9BACT|nr:LamG-like jellyroll fold domain-containing protein [Lacipirellula parvula]BBO32830.1 hypothetical protein PLANPX_2442 [Lacipirellula parvula]
MNSVRRLITPIFALSLTCGGTARAANLLYNFEGDSGTTVTDKLTSDGAQNGVIYNNVDPTDNFDPRFGNQAAFFDNPPPLAEGDFSSIEIPDSTLAAGASFTLGGWVNQDVVSLPTARFRIFSSFSSGTVPNNVLLLDSGRSATNSSLRGIVGGIQFTGTVTPALSPGYHHYAMTVDGTVSGNSAVQLYIDGNPISTTASGTLGAYSNTVNLRIGEDVSLYPRTNSANEQIVGNADDMFMISRSLSPAQISSIYNGGTGAPVSNVITPVGGEKAVYYNFEGDTGTTVTDKFTLDGNQNGIVRASGTVDSAAANAKVGNTSFNFLDPQPPTTPGNQIFSQINAGQVGDLGPNFTISAVVNPYTNGQVSNGVARILSSYAGTGSTAGSLILDFNPSTVTGIRLFLPSNTGAATLTVAGPNKPDLNINTKQTLTIVYETGTTNDSVKLYLDGTLVASKTDLPAGTVQTLGTNELRIGEDRGGYRGAYANENFTGSMDDVMILGRALTPEQVTFLNANGADALIATLPTGIPGDFNADSKVDGADFLVWQRNTSVGSLNDWKTNFGTVGAEGAVGVVPEPATAAMACVGFAALFTRRSRRFPA